jgi:hypothetical protein
MFWGPKNEVFAKIGQKTHFGHMWNGLVTTWVLFCTCPPPRPILHKYGETIQVWLKHQTNAYSYELLHPKGCIYIVSSLKQACINIALCFEAPKMKFLVKVAKSCILATCGMGWSRHGHLFAPVHLPAQFCNNMGKDFKAIWTPLLCMHNMLTGATVLLWPFNYNSC